MSPFLDSYPDVLVKGARRPFALKLSFVRLGKVLVELLEPLDGYSPHAAFLKRHGPGVHHLGFQVGEIEHSERRLVKLGMRRLVDASQAPASSHWVYLGRDVSGWAVELMAQTPEGDEFFSRVDEALRTPAPDVA